MPVVWSVVGLLLLGGVAVRAEPVTTTQVSSDLPADVLAMLRDVQDFSFSFGQPGFYAVLRYVHETSRPPGLDGSLTIQDWGALLERPAEFRGLPITITGTVGRNSAWQERGESADLGPVWQLELVGHKQPLPCTLILTGDASDIPLKAQVTVTGYFVMVRQYYDRRRRPQVALLVVGQAPTLLVNSAFVPPPASLETLMGRSVLPWLITLALATVVIWRLLRRGTQSRPVSPVDGRIRPTRQPGVNLSDQLDEMAAATGAAGPADLDALADEVENAANPADRARSESGGLTGGHDAAH